MPSRTKDVKTGVRPVLNSYRRGSLPLFLLALRNFLIVIPKKTAGSVISVITPDNRTKDFIPVIQNVGILPGQNKGLIYRCILWS